MVTWYSDNINLAPVHTITTPTYSTKSALSSNEAQVLGTYNYNTTQDLESSEAHNILFSYVSHTYTPIYDKDNNRYNYITIGTQQWVVENLKTTKYADLTPILNFTPDWFLPAIAELQEMNTQLFLQGVGNFNGGFYWSSTEYNATRGSGLNMTMSAVGYPVKSYMEFVRACRAFTSTTNYNLRDVGPAGGLIFWKSGNNYLEAAPTDQSVSQAWSDVINLAIGTTGTAIGTGQANTTAIIGQVGHTDSAAKLCDDLTSDILWAADITGAYCYYNNDIANKTPYGALYNWYAVDKKYDDWFLPSQDECEVMYNQLKLYNVGNISDNPYWTSSETDQYNSIFYHFKHGIYGSDTKDNVLRARACRSFNSTTNYNLRDIGPAGGYIFWKSESGNDYLEVAAQDNTFQKAFSNLTSQSVSTSTAIGTGLSNTTNIVNQTVGANDWYLPSLNEFNYMYSELYLHGVGGLVSGLYWCSTESGYGDATKINTTTGQYTGEDKQSVLHVRPIRSFISSSSYSLRSIGPAGGFITGIVDNGNSTYTYYEVYTADIEDSIWSNRDPEIGTTSSEVGFGASNTLAIIGQLGHTSSAAKICSELDDYYTHTDSAAFDCFNLEGESLLVYFTEGGIKSEGWRVPSYTDWTTLINYAGGDTVAGGKLKEQDTTHWNTPNLGATNEYGFKSVGSGNRALGSFAAIMEAGTLWSSTVGVTPVLPYAIGLFYNSTSSQIGQAEFNTGFGVRCMRDV